MNIPEAFIANTPRVYHYTTITPLLSIIEKQCLWASHYSCMNDKSELTHIHDVLMHEIKTMILDIIENGSENFEPSIRDAGGKEKLISHEMLVFYDIVCGQHMRDGGVLKELLDQFVISFCSHETLDCYSRENGLLSQWVHYGGKAGCAIGFDTRALCNMLQKEEEEYAIAADINAVIYKNAFYKNDKDVRILLEYISTAYDLWRKNDIPAASALAKKLFAPLVEVASRLKHEAFFSENEIRIIILPLGEHRDDKKRKRKNIEYRTRENMLLVPYIPIFGCDGKKLPITDIIIGPSREQERLGISIKRLCEPVGISIHLSKTPLVIS